MSEVRHFDPFTNGGWRIGPDGTRSFIVEGRSAAGFPLAQDQLWVMALAAECQGVALTFDDLVKRADHLAPAGPRRDEALANIWRTLCHPHPPDPAIGLWERHGWKLALDAYVRMEEPAQHSLTGVVRSGSDHDRRATPVPDEALVEAMQRRRTCRTFNGSTMPVEVLQSILATLHPPALTPAHLVCHVLAFRVAGLADGVYCHTADQWAPVRRVPGHLLEQEAVRMLIGQHYIVGSAVGILLSGELERVIVAARRPSAFPAWLICAGAAAQRIILSAEALGFASFLSAAIDELRAEELTESRLYPAHMVTLGVGVS